MFLSLRYIFNASKLATVDKGDPKAPFSVATTLSCWEERYFLPWNAPLCPSYIVYIAEW